MRLCLRPLRARRRRGTSMVATLVVLVATVFPLVGPAASRASAAPSGMVWWDDDWAYRVTVVVGGGDVDRVDPVVEVPLDLDATFAPAGAAGGVEPSSIRVVEVDADGAPVTAPLLAQFDRSGPDDGNATNGTVAFVLPGKLGGGDTRTVHVYAKPAGSVPVSLGLPAKVRLTDLGSWHGSPTFEVGTEAGTWYVDRDGGAISAVVDRDGHDWIAGDATAVPAGGRGIPQLPQPEPLFRPASGAATTTVQARGPVKVTVVSTSFDGRWSYRNEFFPRFVRSTVTAADGSFAFRYEGTPGGTFDGGSTTVLRATPSNPAPLTGVTRNIAASSLTTEWSQPAGSVDWAAFAVHGPAGVGDGGRALVLADHQRTSATSYTSVEGTTARLSFDTTGAVPQSFGLALLATVDPLAIDAAMAANASMPTVSVADAVARPASDGADDPDRGGAGFVPVAPRRVLDTRVAADGPALAAGVTRRVRLGDLAGLPASADAVVLNVTLVDATADAYLRVWPADTPMPATSNLNTATGGRGGRATANLVTTPLGADGAVDFLLSSGSAELIVDVLGSFTTAATGGFHPNEPLRVLDTRSSAGRVAVGPGEAIVLDLDDALGVASGQLAAVAMTVTATEATATTYVTAYGGDVVGVPPTSNLNVHAGGTVANGVVVGVDRDGRAVVRNAAGAVHLIVDVTGWFDRDGAVATDGLRFHAMTPVRLDDTRATGPLGAGTVRTVALAGGGVPAEARAVAVNLTATEATSVAHLTLWSGESALPVASTLNVVPGDTRAGLVFLGVGSTRRMAISVSAGTAHVVHDVVGWFG